MRKGFYFLYFVCIHALILQPPPLPLVSNLRNPKAGVSAPAACSLLSDAEPNDDVRHMRDDRKTADFAGSDEFSIAASPLLPGSDATAQ